METTELEKKLGHSFINKNLLKRALIRRAYALERKQKFSEDCEDQEVFCIVGDAVLQLILIDKLFELGYETREKMTTKKIELVRKETLATISNEMGVGSHILLGIGEKKLQAETQPRVLAETQEALIGAIFLDVGYERSKKIILKWFDRFFT